MDILSSFGVSDLDLLKEMKVNPERVALGNMCKRNHEWRDSGQSLRYYATVKGVRKLVMCYDCYWLSVNGLKNVATEEDNQLLRDHGLNPDNFYLGKLCKRKHDWNGSGKTLRRTNINTCPACNGVKNPGSGMKPDKSKYHDLIIKAGFSPETHYVGKLCPKGHDFENTGGSIRRGGACLICDCKDENNFRRNVKSIEERFEAAVIKGENPDDCWKWGKFKTDEGYGRIAWKERKEYCAHRVSYILHKGDIPTGYLVRHMCHNPECTNPLHLEVGTVKQNYDDMVDAGRRVNVRGEKVSSAKLKEWEVLEMRELLRNGIILTEEQVSEMYKISFFGYFQAVTGQHWKHLPM